MVAHNRVPIALEQARVVDARHALEHLHHPLDAKANVGRDLLRVHEVPDLERADVQLTAIAPHLPVRPLALGILAHDVAAPLPERAMIVASWMNVDVGDRDPEPLDDPI